MSKSTDITSNSDESIWGSRTESPYGVQDWQNIVNKFETPSKPVRSALVQRYFDALWPAADPYVSKFNPVFLLDLPAVSKSDAPKKWLVRDGIVPTMWFFTKNPTPGGFRDTLIFNAELEEFIPDEWRPQVELFDFLPEGTEDFSLRENRDANEITELLLVGIITPSICSLKKLEDDLKNLTVFAGDVEALEKIKIKACLPVRHAGNDVLHGESFYNLYHQILNRYLGNRIEFIGINALHWLCATSSSWVHEFNERCLIVDSQLTSLALSRGFRVVPTSQEAAPAADRRTHDRIVPVYPHRSLGIRARFMKPFIKYLSSNWIPENQERSQKFYAAKNSTANMSHPWPEMFEGWCASYGAPVLTKPVDSQSAVVGDPPI